MTSISDLDAIMRYAAMVANCERRTWAMDHDRNTWGIIRAAEEWTDQNGVPNEAITEAGPGK